MIVDDTRAVYTVGWEDNTYDLNEVIVVEQLPRITERLAALGAEQT